MFMPSPKKHHKPSRQHCVHLEQEEQQSQSACAPKISQWRRLDDDLQEPVIGCKRVGYPTAKRMTRANHGLEAEVSTFQMANEMYIFNRGQLTTETASGIC